MNAINRVFDASGAVRDERLPVLVLLPDPSLAVSARPREIETEPA